MMKKICLVVLMSVGLWANSVFTHTLDRPMEEVYRELLEKFAQAHLVVVSEINILQKFKDVGLPKKFGENFNTNELTGIRAIIACNGWFGNEVANADPEMMAFCPIRVTLIEKDGKTTLMFVRPGVAPKETKAYGVLLKLEDKVISTIKSIEKE